jgi:hypothetical protein
VKRVEEEKAFLQVLQGCRKYLIIINNPIELFSTAGLSLFVPDYGIVLQRVEKSHDTL